MTYYPRRGAGGEVFPDEQFLLWLVVKEGLSNLVEIDADGNPILDAVNDWFNGQPEQYQQNLHNQYGQYQQRQTKEVERRATILERKGLPTSIGTRGNEVPVVKWRLYDTYAEQVVKPDGTKETIERGIFVPILMPNQATPANLTTAFQSLYSGIIGEGNEVIDISPISGAELGLNFEEFSPELSYLSLRSVLEDAKLPPELLDTPDIQDYLARQSRLMASGQRVSDPAAVISEITKMQYSPDYINRLRATGQAEGEVPESYRRADLQKMGALLGVFDEPTGDTEDNEIARMERALEKLRPVAEEYQGLIEKGLVDPMRGPGGSELIGLGKLETYKQIQQRLAQLQSGQIIPAGISKTQVEGALGAGVPITKYAGLSQQYIANPEDPQFATLSMPERQTLAKAGLSAEGGGDGEDIARRQAEARRKKIQEEYEAMRRELKLAPSRRAQRIVRL